MSRAKKECVNQPPRQTCSWLTEATVEPLSEDIYPVQQLSNLDYVLSSWCYLSFFTHSLKAEEQKGKKKTKKHLIWKIR